MGTIPDKGTIMKITTEFMLQAAKEVVALGLTVAFAINMIVNGATLDALDILGQVLIAAITLGASLKGQLQYTQSRTEFKIESMKNSKE